jgi:small subunit ribosomal protein S2
LDVAVENLLLPREVLLSAGVHIGTRVKNKDMGRFIYKVRNDGLYILDMEKMNDRIKAAGKFFSRVDPSKLLVVSSKRYGRTPVEKFCGLIGAKMMVGRFTSGTLTNPRCGTYTEPEVLLVTDPLADMQALEEASTMGIPVVALCSTDNSSANVDLVIPLNNKGRRALAVAYWLLCREIKREKKEIPPEGDLAVSIDDFESSMKE